MTSQPSLRGAIEAAINSYCAEYGFGFPTGFVYCISRITETGENALVLGSQEGQHTSLSLGLAHYLHKKFECDAVDELDSFQTACSEDED